MPFLALLRSAFVSFIQGTANEYGIRYAGSESRHSGSGYQLAEFANRANDYYRLRRERRNYRKKGKPKRVIKLNEALRIIKSGEVRDHQKDAAAYLRYSQKLAEYDREVLDSRADFRKYLEANVENRNIFNRRDLDFIVGFDERFTYRKPVSSMVKMMARSLRARQGNILAATVGYNAGLSSTAASGIYKPYGRIPAIEQSTTYLSHILVNHYEINQLMR